MTGPTEVVRAAVAAADRGEWRQVASLISPDALKRIQETQLAMFATLPLLDVPGPIGGSLVAMPSSPLSAQALKTRVRSMPGAPTLGELGAMTPDDFYVRWQEACPRLRWWERVMNWAKARLVGDPERPDQPTQVLGAVLEDAGIAHVVYRAPGSVGEQADVITLARRGDRWLMQLNAMAMGHDPFQSRASSMAFLELTRPRLGATMWSLARVAWRRFRPHQVARPQG